MGFSFLVFFCVEFFYPGGHLFLYVREVLLCDFIENILYALTLVFLYPELKG